MKPMLKKKKIRKISKSSNFSDSFKKDLSWGYIHAVTITTVTVVI